MATAAAPMMAAMTNAAAKRVALTWTKLEVKLTKKDLASLFANNRSLSKSCAEAEARPMASKRAQFLKAFIVLLDVSGCLDWTGNKR
jgi:hypothetical protein